MVPMVALGTSGLSLDAYIQVVEGAALELDATARAAVTRSASALHQCIADGTVIYGVTTGYGTASDQAIAASDRLAVQLGTLRSHACGTGPLLHRRVARGMWVAKAASIATGRTGASLTLLDQLIDLLNANLAPAVPEIGSLGASGDLVPSGHAGLPVVGEGEVLSNPIPIAASSALHRAGLAPIVLGPRDGLSLVNGTAATVSLGAVAVWDAAAVLDLADDLTASGLEASGGHLDAFDDDVGGARQHPGAAISARRVRDGVVGAPSHTFGLRGIHDPYSWRCTPAVHGAARDAHTVAATAIADELRGCSDNPLIDVRSDGSIQVRSGGNFHGAPLGLPLDHLVRGLGEVVALSSRRIAQLLSGRRGAPAGLTHIAAGGNGLTQLLATATALVLEIRGMPSATGNWLPVDDAEDHTSNATTAARNAYRAVELTRTALACEAIVIAAHTDLAQVEPRGRALRMVYNVVRGQLETPTQDVRLDRAIQAVNGQFSKPNVHVTHM